MVDTAFDVRTEFDVSATNLKHLKIMTYIKALEDLYNGGKCFTKGKIYEVSKDVSMESSLMECYAKNNLGEMHLIGSWWREFEIIEPTYTGTYLGD